MQYSIEGFLHNIGFFYGLLGVVQLLETQGPCEGTITIRFETPLKWVDVVVVMDIGIQES